MSTSPKSFIQILNDMMAKAIKDTTVGDLKTGSVIDAFMDAETQMRNEAHRIALVRFLTQLDPRFRKHISPWAEVQVAQRYFSKL